MDRVARKIEAEQYFRQILAAQRPEPDATASDAITAAARQVAETLERRRHRHLHDLGLDGAQGLARAARACRSLC